MKKERLWLMAAGFAIVIVILYYVASAFDSKPSVMGGNSGGDGSAESAATVPWDYQITEGSVGDLLGSDLVLLPGNQRISNDQNFATGDAVWVLNYMSAEMRTNAEGKNDVKLSAWQPIKTFASKAEAEKDLAELKSEIKTEVELVGVYKTQLADQSRYFAVVTMPTGHKVKQPLQEARYKSFMNKKQVQVVLEEVHDYSDYDLTMAKFRGWAE